MGIVGFPPGSPRSIVLTVSLKAKHGATVFGPVAGLPSLDPGWADIRAGASLIKTRFFSHF